MNIGIATGKHYLTRSGAIVEIVRVEDTGLTYYDLSGKPVGSAKLVQCKVVRTIDGEPYDAKRTYFVDGRGLHYPGIQRGPYTGYSLEHGDPLDLIREANADERAGSAA